MKDPVVVLGSTPMANSLEGLILFTTALVLLAAYYKLKEGKQIEKQKRESTNEIYQIRLTPFPLLDGLIAYLKIRQCGFALFDKVGATTKCNVGVAKVGMKSVYFVRDVDVAQKLFKSVLYDHLDKPEEFYSFLFPGPLSRGLVAAGLSVWKLHRKVLAPAFSYRALGIYFQHANDCARECMEDAYRLPTNKEECQIRELLDHYGFQFTSYVLMGRECSAKMKPDLANFHKNITAMKDGIMHRFLNPLLLLRPIWMFHPKKKALDSVFSTFSQVSHAAIKKYRELQYSRKISPCINSPGHLEKYERVDGVTEAKNTGPDDTSDDTNMSKRTENVMEKLLASDLTDDEMVDEIVTFFTAGYETVRVALDLLIFQLAAHPEYQRQCQEEVDSIFTSFSSEENKTGGLTLDDLSKLKYVEQCVLESLRVIPTVPMVARKLHAPLQINENLTMNAGEMVVISPWGIHRNPEYYPNPEVFDPDRFTAENIKKRHQYCYLPFSSGKRSCIGNKLAMIQMKVSIAWLLRYYDLSTTDKVDDIKFFFDITLRLERPYNIRYKKRLIEQSKE